MDVRYTASPGGYTMALLAVDTNALSRVRFWFSDFGFNEETQTLVTPWTSMFRVAGDATASYGAQGLSFQPKTTGVPASATLIYDARPTGGPTEMSANNLVADTESSIFVLGTTRLFAALNPASAQCPILGTVGLYACFDVYVAKFDRTGTFRYLVLLQGDSADAASQIEIDSGGNVYVAGTTASANFVTTDSSVYKGPVNPVFENRVFSGGDLFFAKLHGPTGGLIYSTLIGGSSQDALQQMRADVFGRTFALVQTRSADFPRTADPPLSAPQCVQTVGDASRQCWYVMSLSENGTDLRYSEQVSAGRLEATRYGTVYLLSNPTTPTANTVAPTVALWPDGSLRSAISTDQLTSQAIPALDESLWLVDNVVSPPPDFVWQNARLLKIESDGQGPEVQNPAIPRSSVAAIDGEYNIWLTGDFESTPDAPMPAGCAGCTTAALVNQTGQVLFATGVNGVPLRAVNGKLFGFGRFDQNSDPQAPDVFIIDPVGTQK